MVKYAFVCLIISMCQTRIDITAADFYACVFPRDVRRRLERWALVTVRFGQARLFKYAVRMLWIMHFGILGKFALCF